VTRDLQICRNMKVDLRGGYAGLIWLSGLRSIGLSDLDLRGWYLTAIYHFNNTTRGMTRECAVNVRI